MKYLRFIPAVMLLALLVAVQAPVAVGQADSNNVIWNATYHNNSYLGEPAILSRQESSVSFDWGAGSPDATVNSDYFSARFTTTFNFVEDFYRFRVAADDGVRVIIDNSIVVIDTFDNPSPGQDVIADVEMSSGIHTIQIDYREVTGLALLQVGWIPINNPGETKFIPPANVGVTTETTNSVAPLTDWTARYYNNRTLSGSPQVVVTELTPSHNWGVGAPIPGFPADNFSAEWTSTFYLDGTYDITVRADDGVRVYVDGQLFIDEWHSATQQTYVRRFSLSEGNHTIVIQYYEDGGVAFLDYELTPVSNVGVANPVPVVSSAREWLVQYYNNPALAGDPILVQSEDRVSRSWNQGAPISSMSPDNFSVRFISNPEFPAGRYLIRVRADDGVRVYVDDILYIDEWRLSNGSTQYVAEVDLTEGLHVITIEYYDSAGNAFIEYSIDPITATTPLVTSIDTPQETGDPATATVIASRLNVRSEPNVFAPILTKVSRGETYQVVGENSTGTWIQLNVNGQIGWVNETYTDEFNYVNIPVVDETLIDTPDISGYTAITTANLNMRRGPGLEYDVIRIIPESTNISLEARTIDADWWLVSYNGNVGWVTEAFLNLSPAVNINDIVLVP